MATPLYSVFPAVFDGVSINNIDSVTYSPNVKAISHQPGGSLDMSLQAVAFAEPNVKMKSRDVGQVLANVSATAGTLVTTSAQIQYQSRTGLGFGSSGTHVILTGTSGMILIEDFGAKQDDADGADINLMFHPFSSDGLTNPIAVNVAGSLTSSPVVNGLYALGPVNFEGITGGMQGVQSVRYKSGIKYQVHRADGALFATRGRVSSRAPTIEIETNNLGILSTTGSVQTAISNGITCYLQRVLPGTGRVPYGTASHVSVRATAGAYVVEEIPASQRDSDATIRITVMLNGTATISTATASVIP